jgi:hypothetical protein
MSKLIKSYQKHPLSDIKTQEQLDRKIAKVLKVPL